MAIIIKPKNLDPDMVYEPPLSIGFAIDKKTAEGTPFTMGHTIIPPGGRNQRHYHINTAAGMYIMKGKLRFFIGPDKQEAEAEAGDFLYSPRGEIHGLLNLSDTESAELIFTYPSAPSKDDAGTVYLEPVWK